MPKHEKQRPPVHVPPDWWLRLRAFCKKKWAHDQKPGDAPFDIYQFTGISRRTFSTARNTNKFTESTFALLVDQTGCETPDELLGVLSPPSDKPRRLLRTSVSPLSVENSQSFVLSTKNSMPQWADHRELNLGGERLELLKCEIKTQSPYFRFGFKLLNENERLYGDGSIKSQDANLVVHVGRNNWNRPNVGISTKDIFFTWYLNGVSLEADRKLFSAGRRLTASIELRIDSSYVATFSVNGIRCLNQVIPPGISRRVAVLAWGDREEYSVEVGELSVNPASGS